MLKKNQLIGKIINNKIEKTLVVLVITKYIHPIYKKVILKNKKYFVHQPYIGLNKNYPINSFVIIKKSRPISKKKHWIIEKFYL